MAAGDCHRGRFKLVVTPEALACSEHGGNADGTSGKRRVGRFGQPILDFIRDDFAFERVTV